MTGTPKRRTTMGLTSDSFQSIRFASPQRLLEVDRLMTLAAGVGAAGAHGGMTQIDMDWAKRTRQMKEDLGDVRRGPDVPAARRPRGLRTRGQGREGGGRHQPARRLPPRPALRDVRDSRGMEEGDRRLPQADRRRGPDRREYKMPLGIENHKDWRVDEQVALLRQYDSEFLGVSLDTGNNLTVLDNPMEAVEKLAPFTFNVHLKDMAALENERGYLLSEVPLGEGMLDIKGMVAAVRRARPDVYFSLEMITRDPLEVPCLDEKYWATFDDVNGVHLARLLRLIRAHRPASLPRISGLTPEERYALELEFVDRSIDYACRELGWRFEPRNDPIRRCRRSTSHRGRRDFGPRTTRISLITLGILASSAAPATHLA